MSITVAETIREPWIGTDLLKLLQETSAFDYVEFIDPTGLNHNAGGATSDSSDRTNYLRGIQGEIIGVLNGMFREETLRKAISVAFFGSDREEHDLWDRYFLLRLQFPHRKFAGRLMRSNGMSGESLSEIQDAFTHRDAFYCTARSAEGDVSISLIPIGEEWVLEETRFDLANEISPILDEVRSAIMEKELRLEIDMLPFDHGAVLGDAEWFQQVLRNLLDNVVKYTPPGGTVTFWAQDLPSCALKSGY